MAFNFTTIISLKTICNMFLIALLPCTPFVAPLRPLSISTFKVLDGHISMNLICDEKFQFPTSFVLTSADYRFSQNLMFFSGSKKSENRTSFYSMLFFCYKCSNFTQLTEETLVLQRKVKHRQYIKSQSEDICIDRRPQDLLLHPRHLEYVTFFNILF